MQNLIKREDVFTDENNKFLFKLVFTEKPELEYKLIVSFVNDTKIHAVFYFEGTASGYREAVAKMDEITEKGYY